MSADAFRVWARLMHRATDTLYEDAMIAATAQVHKLIVVTRNVVDFRDFGVSVLNPVRLTQKMNGLDRKADLIFIDAMARSSRGMPAKYRARPSSSRRRFAARPSFRP